MLAENAAVLAKLPQDMRPIWDIFFQIAEVPHGSHNPNDIIPFYRSFLDGLKASVPGLTYVVDKTNNVIISVPASAGHESAPGVCLQGHWDMVAVKSTKVEHDFKKDPLKLRIINEGGADWLKATLTTLGADNSMGVAMSLALITEHLRDKSFIHGPLEILITSDEETGLIGATELVDGTLKSKYLINMDSEEFGDVCISCAGGFRVDFKTPVRRVAFPGCDKFKIALTDFTGGHSGCDIHLFRANCIKLLARFVNKIPHARLVFMQSGLAHNAIPGFATFVVAAPGGQETVDSLQALFKDIYQPAYGVTDKNGKMDITKITCTEHTPLCEEDSRKIVNFLNVMPTGPLRMSPVMEGLVETSFAITVADMKPTGDEFTCYGSGRSSVETELDYCYETLCSLAALAGIEASPATSRYPGWPANPDSMLLKTVVEKYKEVIHKDPRVSAIHAGLEAGLITKKHPGMEAVSVGPTICHPHGPDEKVEVGTISPTYLVVKKTLQGIAHGAK